MKIIEKIEDLKQELTLPEKIQFLLCDIETGGLSGYLGSGKFGQYEYPLLQIAGMFLGPDFSISAVSNADKFNITFNCIPNAENISEWSYNEFKDTLLPKCALSTYLPKELDTVLSDMLSSHGIEENSIILIGNSCKLDYDFIEVKLPKFFKFLHYRMIDVSSLKEFNKKILNGTEPLVKDNSHDALNDAFESGLELDLYKNMFSK